MTPETLLTVSQLSVGFAGARRKGPNHRKPVHQILNGVSFDVAPGQRVGILGESGSGKSTCARAIAGLLPDDSMVSGRVVLKGKTLLDTTGVDQEESALPSHSKLNRTPRRDYLPLQFVFQDPSSSMDPRQKIGSALAEVIRVGAHHKGQIAPERSDVLSKLIAALNEVGVDPSFAERYPHELSGGQLQRVAIAKALLLEPNLLIADEAVSALDLSLQAQIIALLDRLAESRSLAILFISHDLKLVRYFCEQIVILKDGQVAESGPTESVFLQPQSSYTRDLIRASV